VRRAPRRCAASRGCAQGCAGDRGHPSMVCVVRRPA
jgi:hypothetical protein